MLKAPATDDAALSIAWIEEHGDAYRGSWVAVQAGKLVGVAYSRDWLLRALGRTDRSKLLITKID